MTFTTIRMPFGYYLYDRYVDDLIEISESQFSELEKVEKGDISEDDSSILNYFKEKGVCLNPLQIIEHPETKFLQEHLESNIENVILQVTQNCNLRCDYCTYSAKYSGRHFTNKKMSWDIAKASVDFLMQRSSNSIRTVLGFYGGEPILEFDLIKDVVNYIEKTYPGKTVTFALTTNGTLMTDEVIDFMVKKNFNLMFSIDGPISIHNHQRRFINNQGSFDLLFAAMHKIRERYPEYYYSKCTTNTVLSPRENYKSIYDFFSTNPIMQNIHHNMALISEVGANEDVKYDDFLSMTIKSEKTKSLLSMLNYVRGKNVSILYDDYKSDLHTMYRSLKKKCVKTKKNHPGGPCIPGSQKCLVDTEGRIYPCEKITEIESLSIGDIFEGFDLDKVKSMLNIAEITKDECIGCWAFSFCSQCVTTALNRDNKIDREQRLAACDSVRRNMKGQLKEFLTLRHYEYDFEKM